MTIKDLYEKRDEIVTLDQRIKKSLKELAERTRISGGKDIVFGSQPQLDGFKRITKTMKGDVDGLVEILKPFVAAIRSEGDLQGIDEKPVAAGDITYKHLLKVLLKYKEYRHYELATHSTAELRTRATEEFFSFLDSKYFAAIFDTVHDELISNTKGKFKNFKDEGGKLPPTTTDLEKNPVYIFITNVLNVAKSSPQYTVSDLPDSVKQLYGSQDWWPKEASEPEEELDIEKFKEEVNSQLAEEEPLYNHIKKMLNNEDVEWNDGLLQEDEEAPKLDVKNIKLKLKELKKIREEIKNGKIYITSPPSEDFKDLFKKYVEAYEAVRNLMGHTGDTDDKSAEEEALTSATAVNAHLRRYFKFSLFKKVIGTEELYTAFMYLYIYAKDDPALAEYMREPTGTPPAASKKLLLKKHRKFFKDDPKLQPMLDGFETILASKPILNKIKGITKELEDFNFKDDLTKNATFMQKLEFPLAGRDPDAEEETKYPEAWTDKDLTDNEKELLSKFLKDLGADLLQEGLTLKDLEKITPEKIQAAKNNLTREELEQLQRILQKFNKIEELGIKMETGSSTSTEKSSSEVEEITKEVAPVAKKHKEEVQEKHPNAEEEKVAITTIKTFFDKIEDYITDSSLMKAIRGLSDSDQEELKTKVKEKILENEPTPENIKLDTPKALINWLWTAPPDLREKRINDIVGFFQSYIKTHNFSYEEGGDTWAEKQFPITSIEAEGDKIVFQGVDINGQRHKEAYDLSGKDIKKMSREISVSTQPGKNHESTSPLYSYRDKKWWEKMLGPLALPFSKPDYQEQIERSLQPIIEEILREEYGKKELYY